MNSRQGLWLRTRQFGKAYVITDTYQNGGALAVEIVVESDETSNVLSVNLPEFSHLLGEGEFFAKTWSENEEIAEDALASGHFRDTGRSSGDFLNARIWAFS